MGFRCSINVTYKTMNHNNRLTVGLSFFPEWWPRWTPPLGGHPPQTSGPSLPAPRTTHLRTDRPHYQSPARKHIFLRQETDNCFESRLSIFPKELLCFMCSLPACWVVPSEPWSRSETERTPAAGRPPPGETPGQEEDTLRGKANTDRVCSMFQKYSDSKQTFDSFLEATERL